MVQDSAPGSQYAAGSSDWRRDRDDKGKAAGKVPGKGKGKGKATGGEAKGKAGVVLGGGFADYNPGCGKGRKAGFGG